MEERESGRKKKAGRPAKTVKKEIRACVRYTKIEYFIIKEKAGKANLNVSEYIRQLSIHGKVNARLSQEEQTWIRQLIGMANNLNQLAKACHQQGISQALISFEWYRTELDELFKKLKQ